MLNYNQIISRRRDATIPYVEVLFKFMPRFFLVNIFVKRLPMVDQLMRLTWLSLR